MLAPLGANRGVAPCTIVISRRLLGGPPTLRAWCEHSCRSRRPAPSCRRRRRGRAGAGVLPRRLVRRRPHGDHPPGSSGENPAPDVARRVGPRAATTPAASPTGPAQPTAAQSRTPRSDTTRQVAHSWPSMYVAQRPPCSWVQPSICGWHCNRAKRRRRRRLKQQRREEER